MLDGYRFLVQCVDMTRGQAEAFVRGFTAAQGGFRLTRGVERLAKKGHGHRKQRWELDENGGWQAWVPEKPWERANRILGEKGGVK